MAFSKFYRTIKNLKRSSLSVSNSSNGSDGHAIVAPKLVIDLIIKLSRESFNLLAHGGYNNITVSKLNKFAKLVGKELKKDELFFFMKKCVDN